MEDENDEITQKTACNFLRIGLRALLMFRRNGVQGQWQWQTQAHL